VINKPKMHYKCSICIQVFKRVVSFTDLSSFYHHVYLHRLEKNFKIKCGLDSCSNIFTNINTLRTHITRNHSLTDKDSNGFLNSFCNDATTSLIRNIKCRLCNFKSSDLTTYRHHFYKHFNDQILHKCLYKQCSYSSKSLVNFKNHHSYMHKDATIDHVADDLLEISSNNDNSLNDNTNQDEFVSCPHDIEHNFNDPNNCKQNNLGHSSSSNDSSNDIDLRLFYIRLYTKLKDVKLIPKSTCDEIFEDIYEFIRIKDQYLSRLVVESLKTYGVNEAIQQAIVNQIRFSNTYAEIHSQLKGENKKRNFIEESEYFVAPREILLGQDELKKYSFHYVPIKDNLKALLKKKEIRDQLFKIKQSEDGIIKSYRDGSYCKKNNLLNQEESICLEFYADEFEIVNPIGDARGVYKAVGVYYRIGNLHWSLKSTNHTIQLAALCVSRVWSSYGQSKILEAIVKDIKELESEGIDVEIDGLTKTFKATIWVFIGDNKGSNSIGGFVESFGSNVDNFCRFCLFNSKSRQTNFRENESEMRKIDSYLDSTRLASTMPNKIHNGIKYNSILNELMYFNVIEGLPVDYMHDFLEGVVQQTFACMMKKLNLNKILTINSLNKSLKEFKYGKHDRENKVPSELFQQRNINKSGCFRMSASKCWTLLRIFPLIFGETLIHNSYYLNFIRLNQLNRLLLQDEFDQNSILLIEEKVYEYLSEFKELYPETNLTAKQHFLIHYGGNIRKFGPLRHISTMRFESKHCFFKKVAKAINNNRNVTHSMSYRHQLNQYFHFTSAFYFNLPVFGKCTSPTEAQIKDMKRLLLNQANFENALCYSWVDFKGNSRYLI
jgi:hypothetical protein